MHTGRSETGHRGTPILNKTVLLFKWDPSCRESLSSQEVLGLVSSNVEHVVPVSCCWISPNRLLLAGEPKRCHFTCQEAKEALAARAVPHEQRVGHASIAKLHVDALRAHPHLQVAEIHNRIAVLLLQPIGELPSAGRSETFVDYNPCYSDYFQ